MREQGWYRAKCSCSNCWWAGKAVIQHGVEVRRVRCPRCECPRTLHRVVWLWPWNDWIQERTAFRSFCYRCGAGPPMYEVVWEMGCWFARDYNTGEKASPLFGDPAKVAAWIDEQEAVRV